MKKVTHGNVYGVDLDVYDALESIEAFSAGTISVNGLLFLLLIIVIVIVIVTTVVIERIVITSLLLVGNIFSENVLPRGFMAKTISDFFPASMGSVLEPFLPMFGYPRYQIRPSPHCGYSKLSSLDCTNTLQQTCLRLS